MSESIAFAVTLRASYLISDFEMREMRAPMYGVSMELPHTQNLFERVLRFQIITVRDNSHNPKLLREP